MIGNKYIILRIILTALITCFSFGFSALATDQFCYRDTNQVLICEMSIEEIPLDFQKKAFFLSLPESEQDIKPDNSKEKSRHIPVNKSHATSFESNSNFKGLPPARILEPENKTEQDSITDNSITVTDSDQSPKLELSAPPSKNEITASKNRSIVRIIVAEWCGYCRALEKFLKKEQIPFEALDIDEDPRAAALYEEHGSLPISLIGKTLVVGFEPDKYRSLLEANLPY
ncbi:MAG TPA: glutaredoxin family protein [Oligoflexia bacterium]|nr:glutaredoxin family protein [Oligoflexia bacterium]HMP48744.1 glutaredoxin family protein [Oligoflexia bacterium]